MTESENYGVIVYMTVTKTGNNLHIVAGHGYGYKEEPEGKHLTAMARHTYGPEGYIEKKDYEGNPLAVSLFEFYHYKKVEKGQKLDIKSEIQTLCDNIEIPTNKLILISKEIPEDQDLGEGVTIIRMDKNANLIGLSIADTVNAVALERYKTYKGEYTEEQAVVYDSSEYFKEKRTVPDCLVDSKLVLHREIEKGFIYTVNAKDYTDIGRTLSDTTYAVIYTEDEELSSPPELDVYKNKYLTNSERLLILESRMVFQPKISKAVIRYGNGSIIKMGEDVLFNTLGPIKVVLGKHIEKVNLTVRGTTILHTIEDRLRDYLKGNDGDYTEFTEQLDTLTNQKKFLRVKAGGVSYKLMVGIDVPSYNHFRRILKTGGRFYLSLLEVDGMIVYNVLIKHDNYVRLSSNYFCESGYLVKS